ncbi:monocarboxylate transporter 5-like [Parasteatoda tepidariorum]|uniref:monocarboxylate transporter 5-like n=1 Tax=Parasteatoda tepidariorum TaxID=114398 RepID=UPI0039BC7B24
MKRTGLNSWRSWIVAVACAVIYCLFAPVYRLAAIFYAEFVDNFDIDRKSASIPFVVLGFVRCSSGPIYGILGERFGLRCMTLVGCCLCVIGLTASFFAQDVIALSVTIGLFYGFGMTCTALLPSIIRSHFDHNATTISYAIVNLGPGICGIAFPGVIMYFLDVYGVSGALLLSSAILLNSLPLIMILKKPKKITPKVEMQVTRNNMIHETISQQGKIHNEETFATETNRIRTNKDSVGHSETLQLKDDLNIVKITSTFIEKKIPKCMQHSQEGCSCLTLLKKPDSQRFSHPNKIEIISENYQVQVQKKDHPQPVLKDVDIAPSNNNVQEIIQKEFTNAKHSNAITSDKYKGKNKNLFHSLNVLRDPTFIVLTFIQGIAVYTYHVWLTTLIDYSRDKEIDRSFEIYLLTLNPITDIIGRVALAWVTDKGYLSIAKMGALLFMSLSISSIWIAVAKDFAMLASGNMLMTFTSGAYLSICPGMSYAYIEKDKQILSIASYGSLYAPLSFTVSPLIGKNYSIYLIKL